MMLHTARALLLAPILLAATYALAQPFGGASVSRVEVSPASPVLTRPFSISVKGVIHACAEFRSSHTLSGMTLVVDIKVIEIQTLVACPDPSNWTIVERVTESLAPGAYAIAVSLDGARPELVRGISLEVPADSNPVYRNDALQVEISAVDSTSQPGAYQDVVFEYVQGDAWRLVDYKPARPIRVGEINSVELTLTKSFPVQSFLDVKGIFPNGCPHVGKISVRMEATTFRVVMYYDNASVFPPKPIACIQALIPFREIIPLQVYALPAGEYSYTVNDAFTGTFVLERDNELD